MGLMHKMRKNTHIILFFLLIMFVASMTIGGLVGGANIMDLLSGRKSDTVLSVNGEQISYEQYSRALQNEMESFRQKNNQEPQGYQLQQIEDQVWDNIIREVLQRQMIKNIGINATNEEIKYFIFTNPHPIFRMNKNFLNDNNEFDQSKYQAALNSPENDYFWRSAEEYLRTVIIPSEKLNDEIISTVRVTEEELKEEFIKKNQRAKVSYVFFDPNKYDIPDEQITEQEIKNYYKEHADDFKEQEKRKITYVLFETTPSSKDSLEIRNFAEALLDSAKNGADFAELAETYSDDPGSAPKGGDLGFFAKGAMVKPFEEAAFSAKVGEIVGPIKSNFGLHIIKVEDKKLEDGKEKVKARHILLKFKASRDTQETAKDNANYFAEVAKEDGFNQIVIAEKIKADTTDYFTNSGFIPKLGMQKRITMSIFNMKIGKTSKVYLIENRGYLVFQVSAIQKERIKPLDEVRSIIIPKIRRTKQMEKAAEAARNFRKKVQLPENFEKIALKDSLEVRQTDFFTLDGYVSEIGRDVKFNGAAFALYNKEISPPVEARRGYYIIRMDEKQPFNEKAFEAQKDAFKKELLEKKHRDAYTNWFTVLKNQAEIKDYRYMFF